MNDSKKLSFEAIVGKWIADERAGIHTVREASRSSFPGAGGWWEGKIDALEAALAQQAHPEPETCGECALQTEQYRCPDCPHQAEPYREKS